MTNNRKETVFILIKRSFKEDRIRIFEKNDLNKQVIDSMRDTIIVSQNQVSRAKHDSDTIYNSFVHALSD